ncbi:hypothetical protein LAZ67_19001876 [Cordylochernes scorpioides]|uniref:Uncharacterized protein n=1 Tax=Cordylochernes scorpioides TaxID=51811 RepID=A0ABY6LLV1_9ARAC|nr:hypothetical protein LAZ67_19001876 [Cordylochernes scorpioides]
MASAKTRIYKHFLGLQMQRVQEDPSSSGGGPYQGDASEMEFTSLGNKEPKDFKGDSLDKPAKIPKADKPAVRPPQPARGATRGPVTQVKNSRQQQALSKARSAAGPFDQCCYVEYCSNFGPVQYIRALEEILGRGAVF